MTANPKLFDVVYADPPWRYSSNSDKKPGRNARGHYKTMHIDEIRAMPVCSWTNRQAYLFLWATQPMMHLQMGVISAWGFQYKSQVIWDKKIAAHGHWAMGQHEILLIATRGRPPCPKPAMFRSSVYTERRREHSRKPDYFRDTITNALPDAKRLELFARQQFPGWTAWGNQTDHFPAEG